MAMWRIIPVLLIFLPACSKKEANLNPIQIKKRVDSIYNIQAKALSEQYNEDLEIRIKTEVKGKSDSIIQMKQTVPLKDSLNNLNLPVLER